MTRQLPATPSSEHLRKEAKSVLKAHQRGDPVCCEVLRNLHHLSKNRRAGSRHRRLSGGRAIRPGYGLWFQDLDRVNGQGRGAPGYRS